MILFWGLSAVASQFDEEVAYARLQKMVQIGHRYYGAKNRNQAIEYMRNQFTCDVWVVQKFVVEEPVSNKKYTLENHICRIAPELSERVVLGSHFDTRLWAEEDEQEPNKPIPGANDGSSGVVVLMGVSDLIDQKRSTATLNIGVDLILFDGEEFGRPHLGNYCVGSRHLAQNIQELYPERLPLKAVILDMVADKDLMFRPELSSQAKFPELYNELWSLGLTVAPEHFRTKPWGIINDDQTPLMELGIPSALLIDMEYEYWHTQQDTLDKCSAKSLKITGTLMWQWLDLQIFQETR
ncbi:MAG: hypothetical protein CMK59_07745 [Proteobacteria bacterium]|nr:hypothetical protein [Pseudomonadota bacterium]